jgi:glycerophosphoryl diester phosphodiesterase
MDLLRSCKKTVLASALAWMAMGAASQAQAAPASPAAWPPQPALIAHRGASALRPEHTLAAYQQAIDDGADLIEADLVITRDGVLVSRHENAIAILKADGALQEATTDVADRPEFAARRTTKTIDGKAITGWFVEDFTLAELKTLRARERIPQLRPASAAYDGQFEVPTLEEMIALARQQSARTGRTIGLYIETKHPSYFQSIGQPLEKPLLELLTRHGLNRADAPVFIQSFEVDNLRALHAQTQVRLVQLLTPNGSPFDQARAGVPRTTYAKMATPAGLAEIAAYAQGVGPSKTMVIPMADGGHGRPTSLVQDAHAAGLLVHVWTLRPENAFLPAQLKSAPAGNPAQRGNARADMEAFLRAGVDGVFTDDPAIGRAAIDAMQSRP